MMIKNRAAYRLIKCNMIYEQKDNAFSNIKCWRAHQHIQVEFFLRKKTKHQKPKNVVCRHFVIYDSRTKRYFVEMRLN